MIREDRRAFLRSLSLELDVQADRVRQLIGTRHWSTDGAHKEGLLRAFLDRHVPSSIALARGFVINETVADAVSTEQDLLLIDTHSDAPLFRSGDIAITIPSRVMAAVSVKSAYSYDVMNAAVDGLSSVAAALNPTSDPGLWLGLYFFDSDDRSFNIETAARHLLASRALPNLMRLGPELVVRAAASTLLRVSLANSEPRVMGYRADHLSTGVFLSRLLAHLSRRRGADAGIESLLIDLDDDVAQLVVLGAP